VRVLANHAATQAVYDEGTRTLQAVFWTAGSLDTPLGRVTVDQPGFLQLRATAAGRRLHLASALPEVTAITVTLGERRRTVALPRDLAVGQTVAAEL
jgi:hypothetical protein